MRQPFLLFLLCVLASSNEVPVQPMYSYAPEYLEYSVTKQILTPLSSIFQRKVQKDFYVKKAQAMPKQIRISSKSSANQQFFIEFQAKTVSILNEFKNDLNIIQPYSATAAIYPKSGEIIIKKPQVLPNNDLLSKQAEQSITEHSLTPKSDIDWKVNLNQQFSSTINDEDGQQLKIVPGTLINTEKNANLYDSRPIPQNNNLQRNNQLNTKKKPIDGVKGKWQTHQTNLMVFALVIVGLIIVLIAARHKKAKKQNIWSEIKGKVSQQESPIMVEQEEQSLAHPSGSAEDSQDPREVKETDSDEDNLR